LYCVTNRSPFNPVALSQVTVLKDKTEEIMRHFFTDVFDVCLFFLFNAVAGKNPPDWIVMSLELPESFEIYIDKVYIKLELNRVKPTWTERSSRLDNMIDRPSVTFEAYTQ
jgi:hypothetical protein